MRANESEGIGEQVLTRLCLEPGGRPRRVGKRDQVCSLAASHLMYPALAHDVLQTLGVSELGDGEPAKRDDESWPNQGKLPLPPAGTVAYLLPAWHPVPDPGILAGEAAADGSHEDTLAEILLSDPDTFEPAK